MLIFPRFLLIKAEFSSVLTIQFINMKHWTHFSIDDVLLYKWEEQCNTETSINPAQPEENGLITLKHGCFLVKYWLLTWALCCMAEAKFSHLCLNTQKLMQPCQTSSSSYISSIFVLNFPVSNVLIKNMNQNSVDTGFNHSRGGRLDCIFN